MIQETSRKVYHELRAEKKLGRWQKDVLSVIIKNPYGLTIKEVGRILGKPSNEISGRIKELREAGFIELYEKRRCSITGRTAMAWVFIEEKSQMNLF